MDALEANVSGNRSHNLAASVSNGGVDMVIQRELRVMSRRWITYWGRFGAAGVAIFMMWQHSLVANAGRDLFQTAVILGLIACVLDGVRRGAASLAEETAEGTLGLLLLTPLSGKNLLWGKYASVMIATLPMALAIVPMFAIAILLGGVSGSDLLRAALALIHFQSAAVVVSILTSANSRSSGTAMVAALCVIGVAMFMAGILSIGTIFNPINPMTPVTAVFSPRITWSSLISSVLIWQALLQLILREKGRNFAREWRQAEEREIRYASYAARQYQAPPPLSSAVPLKPAYDAVGTPRWFNQNPMEWLTLREMGMHTGPWVFTLAAALCAGFAFLTPVGMFYTVLLTLGLAIFLCVASARPMAVAKQGSLELISTTPLGFRGMVSGNLRALRKIFLWPALIVIVTFAKFAYEQSDDSIPNVILLYFLFELALFFLVTPWIGMWMGLKCKTPLRAVFATMLLTGLVPRLGACVWGDAPYFVVMFFIARRRIYRASELPR